jgi:hypothetical protein
MDAASLAVPAARVAGAVARAGCSRSPAKGFREHAANGMASAITVSRRLKVKQIFTGNIIGGCSVKVVWPASRRALL